MDRKSVTAAAPAKAALRAVAGYRTGRVSLALKTMMRCGRKRFRAARDVA
jgi:hypothetical protein